MDEDDGDLALLHLQLEVETRVEMRLLLFNFQVWHFAAIRRLLRNLPYEIFKVKKRVCQVVIIHWVKLPRLYVCVFACVGLMCLMCLMCPS